MKNTYQKQHASQLEKIHAALPKNASSLLKKFVVSFYAKVPVPDLEKLEPIHEVALAASAYDFIAQRDASEPKIRIFTPTLKEHGYESKNTVIELLNDDMPFLVDSLTAELNRMGLTIRETLHPILRVVRDKNGILKELSSDTTDQAHVKSESLIHFQVSHLHTGLNTKQIQKDLEYVLEHIRSAVSDWHAIMDKAAQTVAELGNAKNYFGKQDIQETCDFLRWLVERNFVFMGYAEYDFYDAKGKEKLSAVAGSKLGVLKISDDVSPRGLEALPADLRHFLLVPQLIEITKSNRRSAIHRPVLMDYIGIKRFDAKGKVIGEARFLGLFTSNVYYQSAEDIPLLRQKITRVLVRSEFDPTSHDGKALKAILEFLPRDEILQMSEDDLFETSMGILILEAKPAVRMFVRKDAFERFVSAMVFVPRERFSTELRQQIQKIIERAFNGTTSAYSTQITEAPLARLHLIIKTIPGEIPAADIAAIEHDIAKNAYLWSDLLMEALRARHSERDSEKLLRMYTSAFPQSYIYRYDSDAAVYDIGKIEEALVSGGLALELFHNKSESESFLHLKIYNPNEEIALSDILPLLENAGFRVIEEHPFSIAVQGTKKHVWIRDFKLQLTDKISLPLEQLKPLIEAMLITVWRGEAENDRFNALVLKAGLSWRQVVIVRSYTKYLKQIGFAHAQSSIEHAMTQHPQIARHIVDLFVARFQPELKDRETKQKSLRATIDAALSQVSNGVEDRILRRYVDMVMATLRTNYFQTLKDGTHKPVLSFKFDSKNVPDLPLPKPFAEIFVYGVRVEGIHLRGGKVARGGLRWSDRHDDFRTEVLGLMKAQMVKNSVIVPVGSKGGFVVKHPPASGSRDAVMEEGIACYTLYLQGLLDITDNIVKGKVTPPAQVVRHDEDDPYLVVAADKGTASFSDIANGVSAAYGFWLDDAFASGGSVGYDHKKMAITARGAWVSVARHFAESGIDITQQDFTVAGIGDMSGDVFGNGMLLSNRIKLVAAFNHMHIFIDPSPDTKASFTERKRLFNLPRSSWKDYNPALISKGGGIYERSAKTIALSKEAQSLLNIGKASVTPDELIRAIILADVDLLWNGGIGTYVKAEDETHEQVGDRANNAIRVNGRELRCKVVGEGGNLGFTQKGRVEYARLGVEGQGGRINTDAIDNSAGVDCSDHEVNIKIAFSQEMARGAITRKKRDELLVSMTDDVATLVLKDNILQTQALTITQAQGVSLIESQGRLMHTLERLNLLNRSIEFLPSDKQMAELKANKKGLTRPELSVLLAYSKMVLYKELLESSLPDEAYFIADLNRYFPKLMQRDFASAIANHPLKREIIATVVTNSMVNRAGITFFFDIAEDTGLPARDIACAYSLARDVFDLRGLWKGIEQADNVSVSVKGEMMGAITTFLERTTLWLLRNLPLPLEIERVYREIAPGVEAMEKSIDNLQSGITREASLKRLQHLKNEGVASGLAQKIANLDVLSSSFDIIAVAGKTGNGIPVTGKVYFDLGLRLAFGSLREGAGLITTGSHWERLAVQSIIADLYDEQRRLTLLVMESKGDVERWIGSHAAATQRYEHFITDMRAGDAPDIAKLMVALRHIRELH